MDKSTKIKIGIGAVAAIGIWYFFLRKKPQGAAQESAGGGGGGGGGMFTPVMPVVPVTPSAPAPSPAAPSVNPNVSNNPIARTTPTNTYVDTGRVRSDVRTQTPTSTGSGASPSGGIYTGGGVTLPGGSVTQGPNSGILTQGTGTRQTLSGSQIASGLSTGGSSFMRSILNFSGNPAIGLTLDRIGKGKF